MSNLIVHGVKIYLREAETENTDIGLYTELGASYFRWIETAITGTADTWAAGILAEGGIGAIKESVDVSVCGNVAKLAGLNITIDNTSRFWNVRNATDIALNGCQAEIVEFVKDKDSGTVTETVIYYGETALDNWSIGSYVIPIVPTHYKRNAQILTLIDETNSPDADDKIIGTAIPATFGEFNSSTVYAQLVRTANAEETYFTSSVLAAVPGYANLYINSTLTPASSTFPIVANDGDTPPIKYAVKVGYTVTEGHFTNWILNGVEQTSGTLDLTSAFEDCYLAVVDGTGTGKYRKITDAYVDLDVDKSLIQVTVADYFEETLVGNSTATITNQSWVMIKRIAREYEADRWPCKNFTDGSGAALTSGLELYAYVEPKKVVVSGSAETVPVIETQFQYLRLPQYAYDENSDNTDHNSVVIDVKLFDTTPDQMTSFLILPVDSPALYNQANAAEWLDDSYLKQVTGVYSNNGTDSQHELHDVVRDPTYLIDKINDGDHDYRFKSNQNVSNKPLTSAVIVSFQFPEIPSWFAFDRCYAIIDMDATACTRVLIRWRRWIGAAQDGLTLTEIGRNLSNVNWVIACMPDFYLSSDPNTKNKYFYFKQSGALVGLEYFTTGHSNFILSGITNNEIYESITQGALILWQAFETLAGTAEMSYKIREFAIGLSKTVGISGAVYTPMQGRIFNDTWGSRKTATTLISSPVDIFEHVCRLQNWSEVGSTAQPGKAYSADAKINEALFDAVDLDYLRTVSTAFQITDESLGNTEAFKRELCRTGWFINYVDEAGKECVVTLRSTAGAIADTITFADIPDDAEPGEVREPDVRDIFCEPFVRYQFNPATGEYNKIARVTNIEKATWLAAYTPGMSAAAGERIWNKCKALYTKYQHIEEPPSEMTDQYMLRDQTDAENFIEYWVDFMAKKRLTITIGYTFPGANLWHVGRHVYVNLPFHTNGVTKECVIEGIEKDKNNGVIILDLIILTLDSGTSDLIIESGDEELLIAESGSAANRIEEIGVA